MLKHLAITALATSLLATAAQARDELAFGALTSMRYAEKNCTLYPHPEVLDRYLADHGEPPFPVTEQDAASLAALNMEDIVEDSFMCNKLWDRFGTRGDTLPGLFDRPGVQPQVQ